MGEGGMHDPSTELAAYRTSSAQQTILLDLLRSQQQLEAMHREDWPKSRRKSLNIDYSGTILRDIGNTRQAQALVAVSMDDLSRLTEKLAFRSADLRQRLKQLKADVENKDNETKDVLKLSPEKNCTRAAQVKLSLITTTLNGLPVAVLGDAVITRAKNQVKLLESLVRFDRWVVRILFVAGVCLTLYGLIKGIKVAAISD